ncbi:MAG: hypothetical protein ACYTGG_06060, partial [Planctomycetota bacterium]
DNQFWSIVVDETVPHAGFLQITEDDTGQYGPPTELSWLSHAEGAAIGSNVFVPGSETGAQEDTAFAFELSVTPDCNGNGIDDELDIANGTSLDCNSNGVPDECEEDCNGNTVPDDCDLANGTSQDCNGNGVLDECDIADGTSLDCDASGIPDECEASPCAADFDGDCEVGITDLLELLANWGSCS